MDSLIIEDIGAIVGVGWKQILEFTEDDVYPIQEFEIILHVTTEGKCKKCDKIASYNFENKARPIYCKSHIPVGHPERDIPTRDMIPVRRCKFNDCTLLATFRKKGEISRKYCERHTSVIEDDLEPYSSIFLINKKFTDKNQVIDICKQITEYIRGKK